MLATMADVFVEFAIDPRQGPAPLITTFTDQSHGDIEWWKFDFGDGHEFTDHPSVFTHVYTQPGEYWASMQAGNGTLTAGVRKRIQVNQPVPVADFSVSPTHGEPPLEVTFIDASTGSPGSWAWDFGDGAASTAQNPTHLYTHPGVYYPTLMVTNASGSDQVRHETPIVVGSADDFTPTAQGLSPLMLVGIGAAGYVVYRALRSKP